MIKQVRMRLTYANVVSSIALFLVLGGGAAFAALGKNTVGTRQLKKNAVKVGKIGPEAVRAGKLAKNAIATNRLREGVVSTAKLGNLAVTSDKLANFAVTNAKIASDAVTGAKIANDAVTGAKVIESTLAQVPSAADASNAGLLDGIDSSGFVSKPELLWALIDADTGSASVVRSRGAIGASSPGTGRYVVTFNRAISACGIVATLGDATEGAGSPGEISLDQPTGNSVEVNAYNSGGGLENPLATNGFYLLVTC